MYEGQFKKMRIFRKNEKKRKVQEERLINYSRIECNLFGMFPINSAPNVESALFIVNEILPILLKEKPDIRILLSGSSPAKAVLELASKHVTISGWVDDIRESYAKGRIFFAPLNIGTGLQNKLLEAMAMRIPCITSSLANNALKATDKKEILIGNTPEEYKLLILNLLSDPDKSDTVAAAGKQYVENTFNWKVSTQNLIHLIENKK